MTETTNDKRRQPALTLLLHVIRYLTGGVFVFAGFVKLVDPWGAKIKLEDYMEAFGLTPFMPLALVIGVGMAVLEFTVGWALILRIFQKWSVWVLLGFMSFFTLLTLGLAITNPVTDCGCFGDAIKLTNWQTFYKNLVLLAFALSLLKFKDEWFHPKSTVMQGWFLLLVLALGAYIPHYSYYHLPLIDFRNYAAGNDLKQLTTLPDDAKPDVYKDLFYYQKNGEVQEFNEDNYPWQDTTWTFVEMKSVLIEEGDEPIIHDLFILDAQQNDVTQMLIHKPDVQFVVVAYDLKKWNTKNAKRVRNMFTYMNKEGMDFKLLTSSGSDAIEKFRYIMEVPVEVYTADETVLKTIIRSNPGLLVINDGVIVAKFSSEDLPGPNYLKSPVAATIKEGHAGKTQLIILYLLLIFGAGILAPALIEKIKSQLNKSI